MKRFLAWMFLSLLVVAPLARADEPDDQYVSIYTLINQGDAFNEKGQTASAVSKYAEAEGDLKRFQLAYPDWNGKVVKFRLKYLAGKIAQLSAPPTMATNAPPAIATNSPAVAPTNAPPAEPPPAVPTAAPAETPPVAAPTNALPPQASAPIISPAPAISVESENRIKSLQDQVGGLEADRALLQARLKEALSAQPAAVDPQELVKAQDQIRNLQKENELLKVTLAEAKTNIPAAPAPVVASAPPPDLAPQLAEANRKLTEFAEANAKLVSENETLQTRVQSLTTSSDSNLAALRDENTILKKQMAGLKNNDASLSQINDLTLKFKEAQTQLATAQSDKEVLKAENLALKTQAAKLAQVPMSAPPSPVATAPAPASTTNTDRATLAVLDSVTASKIAQLESQRDELQKTLGTMSRDVYGRKKGKETAARIEDMSRQLAGLRARIEIFETREVPYSADELALMSKSDTMLAASAHNMRKTPRELPTSAAVLLAEAKRAFVAHDYPQAEAKYLEVLKLDEKNIDTLADLASIQIELGKSAEAEKNLKAALAIEPNDDYSLFVLGELKFRDKSYDQALDALSRAAQLNPQNARIQNFLGLTLSEKGLRGPAETAFRKALQYDPGYADAHLNLAVVYVTQDPPLLELARWHYQKALAAGHPPSPDVEKMLDAHPVPTASQ